MLWLLIVVLIVMYESVHVCVYMCVAALFSRVSPVCPYTLDKKNNHPFWVGLGRGRAGLGALGGVRPCVLLVSALGWQGGRPLCWDPLSQPEIPQTPRHYSLKGGV